MKHLITLATLLVLGILPAYSLESSPQERSLLPETQCNIIDAPYTIKTTPDRVLLRDGDLTIMSGVDDPGFIHVNQDSTGPTVTSKDTKVIITPAPKQGIKAKIRNGIKSTIKKSWEPARKTYRAAVWVSQKLEPLEPGVRFLSLVGQTALPWFLAVVL